MTLEELRVLLAEPRWHGVPVPLHTIVPGDVIMVGDHPGGAQWAEVRAVGVVTEVIGLGVFHHRARCAAGGGVHCGAHAPC